MSALLGSLQGRMCEAFLEAEFPENVKKTIVHSEIVRYVDQSTVSSLLYAGHGHTQPIPRGDPMHKVLSDFILTAPKLLLICVYVGLEGDRLNKAMQEFIRFAVNDSHLPLTENIVQQAMPDRRAYRLFIDNQSMFIGRILPATSGFTFISMRFEEIFPFTSVKRIADGEFGTVWRARIHGSFLSPRTSQDREVALKRVKRVPHEGEPKAWGREASALKAISDYGVRHFIRINAIIKKGNERYLIFPWANGGNLRDYWKANNTFQQRFSIAQNLIPEIIRQLSGLTEALLRIHEFPSHNGTGVYRHGDLKPENILIFNKELSSNCGTWTMADLGLAQFHNDSTHRRALMGLAATSTAGWGSTSYQPPDTAIQSWAARHKLPVLPTSRLYDIWSMGCIMLQSIVWLIHGMEGIDALQARTRPAFGQDTSTFYTAIEIVVEGRPKIKVTVHDAVNDLMDQMSAHLQSSWVLHRLLRVIRENLLVIDLPKDSRKGEPGCRVTARDLLCSLQEISKACENPVNWSATKDLVRDSTRGTYQGGMNNLKRGFDAHAGNNVSLRGPNTGLPNLHMTYPKHSSSLEQRKDQGIIVDNGPTGSCQYRISSFSTRLTSLGTSINTSEQPLNEIWKFTIDNAFPADLFRSSERFKMLASNTRSTAKLCGKCREIDFYTKCVHITDRYHELREKVKRCDFCKIRWDVGKHYFSTHNRSIRFHQFGSNLQLDGHYPPVLTIHRGPDVASGSSSGFNPLQIGTPQLAEAGTETHFRMLQQWLSDCDRNHPNCGSSNADRTSLPTRLIDVGDTNSAIVKLYETKPGDNLEYFALSHPWGPDSAAHFCTFRSSLAHHIEGIRISELPTTFQDAVRATRSLNRRYLWIDSICIIQGPEGDFHHEAKRMEDVYSQAYCVLAATSAHGQHDGFLKPRDERTYLTIRQGRQPPVHICEFIDNFQEHVLNSGLNKRGWVLQERVLARRTIYFTEKQTYWECGSGVRCETMSKMQNQLASFLGDPKFPRVAIQSSYGGRIRLYQDLYAQYSSLGFSHYKDRPVAIAGLEKRLISSLRVRGGFGVLDDTGPGLLRRSLLWHRAQGLKSLDLIPIDETDGLTSNKPPSWSWMAYKGAINYLELPFDQVDWETTDIISPWATNDLGTWSYSHDKSAKSKKLRVIARDFDTRTSGTAEGGKLILDAPAKTPLPTVALKCVVLGRLKGQANQDMDERIHYVLVVQPKHPDDAAGRNLYVRAGVGIMPGKMISFDVTGAVGEVV